MNALLHWTGVCGVFEPLLILGAGRAGNMNRDNQTMDFSRRSRAHLFLNRRRGAGEVKIQRSGNDAHGGQHARSERGCDEVGRGEALSAALVIDRRVGSQFSAGWRMHRRAVEVTLVFRLDANHIA